MSPTTCTNKCSLRHLIQVCCRIKQSQIMSYCHSGECSDLWDQVWSHDQKEEEQEHSEIDSSENEYEGTALSPPYDIANKDEEINMGTQIVTFAV